MADQTLADLVEQQAAERDDVSKVVKTLGKLEIVKPRLVTNMNILVYGESGVGKTVLAASAAEVPEMSPVLNIDFEGGQMSIAAQGLDVDIVRISQWNQFQELWVQLRGGKHGYKTIIMDSLTEIFNFMMNQIMREVIEKDSDRDPDVPSVREWGKAGSQMRTLIRLFRDLPVNVIFTALVRQEQDEKSKRQTYWPSLAGKMSREAPGYMDFAFYMYKKDVREGDQTVTKRLLMCAGNDQYIAKDRSNRLPQIMEEPTMQKIYTTIHGL